ncbi:adhesion G-protein coupled receptor D2 [Ochotona princeps]|uniref:adhesion G-protein coupled receptor D2 n=1 Tax=Ochotona princeps TaxID=9978 RepID=UPI00271479FC|nr:adhesion G-protein coupled receptor D2 [Ochotona princeps]
MAPCFWCLLYFLVRSLSGTPSSSPARPRNPGVTALMAPEEVVETAELVCRYPGQRLSWWQAQQACEQRFGHLLLGAPEGILAPWLREPLWAAQRQASQQRPPPRRVLLAAALAFRERSAERAARLRLRLPALAALTACAHVQWDATSPAATALFSIATPGLPNALQVRAVAEPGGAVRAALVVRGHHAPFRAISRADGRWHHVCATWEQRGGRWTLFADGRLRSGARGLAAGRPVPSGGVLVLGQDQDSLGGGFSARDAFSGNLTDFHLWTRALGPTQLLRVRACALPPGGLLFRWDPTALDVTPSLLPLAQVHLLCPGASEECPTWDPGTRTEHWELCLQPLPFFCCYGAESHRQLQATRSWPGQDFISRVNVLANATVLLPDPLSGTHGALSLAKVSNFLGILEGVLAEEAAPLGPAALLAVVQFLRAVAALGAGVSEPTQEPWEQLGHGMVAVASRVLEERQASAWLSISKVVGSPMALVASVQHMAPLLSSVLTPEQPWLRIQHHHAGLEVRHLHLGAASARDYVFTVPGGHPEGPGHICIPVGEVRQLLRAGLSGVTVIHSWFSSSVFQLTLREPGPEPLGPANSEQAYRVQRFLSTQVGSAVISSEMWDAAGEVSTAVTFHLQHQTSHQRLVEPVCAFWNFSPDSDTGGSWATTGCSVTAMYPASTACFCNHSTNFAVLLQVRDLQRDPEEESLLRTLSFVGCGISFCALATTFLLLLVAGVPMSERTTVHKNLTFSLALAEGFLMASEWARASKVACVAVTATMHLLFLVAFSWMLVEGLLLWNKVVAVSMRPGPSMRFCYAMGWGAPVLIVAATLAMLPHDYVAPDHCWLSVHTSTIWAFVGPVLFVLTANTGILVRVVVVTVSSARRRAHTLSPQPRLSQQIWIQIWATVKPVLVLLPVLGLTWLVGILVHLSPAWAYAAVGLNSFQGPYIFLVYSAYNVEVQNALQRTVEKAVAAEAPLVPLGMAGGCSTRAHALTCQPCRSSPGLEPGLQPLGPWEAAQGSPLTSTAPRRQAALRGTCGPTMSTAFSSITEHEKPAVELTAFKASELSFPFYKTGRGRPLQAGLESAWPGMEKRDSLRAPPSTRPPPPRALQRLAALLGPPGATEQLPLLTSHPSMGSDDPCAHHHGYPPKWPEQEV